MSDQTDHTAVSVIIMYVIAGMIIACTALVLAFKGVNAMPYDAIGLVGAGVFTAAALGMAQYVKRNAHS